MLAEVRSSSVINFCSISRVLAHPVGVVHDVQTGGNSIPDARKRWTIIRTLAPQRCATHCHDGNQTRGQFQMKDTIGRWATAVCWGGKLAELDLPIAYLPKVTMKAAVLPFNLTLLLAALLIATSPSHADDALPNIVLLMGDDHGWEETGYNGHPYVKTPVLDEMAASGLRLERFYAAHPTCSPTRGSFLTGRHPNRYGTFAPGWSIRPQEITIAHILREAGYHCGHFGKWHVGPVKAESPTNPGAMGFHQWLSHDNFFELNPSLSRDGGPPEVFSGESSEILIDEAIRFIDTARSQDKPFLAVVWFGSPHEPYSGLPQDLALYDDLPARYSDKQVKLTSNETGGQVTRPQGEVLRERYAEITAMDRAIGVLREQLDARQLRHNTLVFYCGDNGTSADGALGFPHRGVKSQVYEGGILVPGLVEWPARITQPRSTALRASTSDLLPTLCAIASEPLPARPLDGINLLPLIDGRMAERSNPLYFWNFNTAALVKRQPQPWIDPELQTGTTPLVKLMGNKATRDFTNYHHGAISDADYLGARAIIDGDLKLVIHDQKNGDAKQELFDLSADPAEKNNLINQQGAVAERLHGQLRQWQASVLQSLSGADYADFAVGGSGSADSRSPP
jgi:arylsulfatase A-like enzyme